MNIVKQLRESAGLQQKEVALAVGVSRPTVSEWEHKKKDPSGERLMSLAKLFNVEPGIILGYQPIPETMSEQDEDIWAFRERVRRDPDYQLLFRAANKATPEHIRAATAVLKSLEPNED